MPPDGRAVRPVLGYVQQCSMEKFLVSLGSRRHQGAVLPGWWPWRLRNCLRLWARYTLRPLPLTSRFPSDFLLFG